MKINILNGNHKFFSYDHDQENADFPDHAVVSFEGSKGKDSIDIYIPESRTDALEAANK